MKNQKLILSVALLLSTFFSQAQLSTGTSDFLVTNGTILSIDGLALTPSTNLSLTNTEFTRVSTPVAGKISGNSILRVYNISQPLAVTGTVGLFYDDEELNGNTPGILAFASRTTTNDWITSINSTLDLPNKYISQVTTGVPINRVTAVNNGIALPILLSAYMAKVDGNRAKIEWTTSSEQNADHFELQRSTDGVNYVTITNIKSTNTDFEHNYYVYDDTPAEGTNYYRLQQYDIDGSKKLFGVKAVVFKGLNIVSVVAYPNPVKSTFGIRILNYSGQQIDLSMFDLNGLLIHKEEIKTHAGQNIYPVNLKRLPPRGDYILKVSGINGLSESTKVTMF
jgi:hypothetical protein